MTNAADIHSRRANPDACDANVGRRFIMLGGGGHSKVVADAITASGGTVIGFRDDHPDAALGPHLQIPFVGPLSDWPPQGQSSSGADSTGGALYFPAVGDNRIRQQVAQRLLAEDGTAAWLAPSVMHPSAVISRFAILDKAALAAPGAVINASAHIGIGSIINTGAIIEHDCRIGEYAHVGPGAVLGGDVVVGAGALIGLGARVLPGVTVGSWATIGAGAVVVAGVPEGATVRGIPAR